MNDKENTVQVKMKVDTKELDEALKKVKKLNKEMKKADRRIKRLAFLSATYEP